MQTSVSKINNTPTTRIPLSHTQRNSIHPTQFLLFPVSLVKPPLPSLLLPHSNPLHLKQIPPPLQKLQPFLPQNLTRSPQLWKIRIPRPLARFQPLIDLLLQLSSFPHCTNSISDGPKLGSDVVVLVEKSSGCRVRETVGLKPAVLGEGVGGVWGGGELTEHAF